jgi:hypothetical protein
LLTAYPEKNKIPLLKKRIRDPSLIRSEQEGEIGTPGLLTDSKHGLFMAQENGYWKKRWEAKA